MTYYSIVPVLVGRTIGVDGYYYDPQPLNPYIYSLFTLLFPASTQVLELIACLWVPI